MLPTPSKDDSASQASRIRTLSAPLPEPTSNVGPELQGLSRSERLFTLQTGMNPQALKVNSDTEFFTFMDLRFEEGWATYKMTSRKYVEATDLYNARLLQANEAKGVVLTIKKRPRAIADKLAEIEAICSQRINAGNFICTFLRSFGESE